MLGKKNTEGLSNYLAGEDDLSKLIHEDALYGFDAMAAGPIPPNAAELLSSTRMRELVVKLTDTYDTVIIDAPPVLGLADIPLLADSVEGVIYTIEAGGVKLRGIQAAIERVRSSHAHIFGGIVTRCRLSIPDTATPMSIPMAKKLRKSSSRERTDPKGW